MTESQTSGFLYHACAKATSYFFSGKMMDIIGREQFSKSSSKSSQTELVENDLNMYGCKTVDALANLSALV